MKVAKLTQTRQPHFGMAYRAQLGTIGLRINTRKLSYKLQKGHDVNKAQGLTVSACNAF